MDLNHRRAIVEISREPKRCTLNGKPAHIAGISLPVAHVVDDENNIGAGWCWKSAARILSTGGKFKT